MYILYINHIVLFFPLAAQTHIPFISHHSKLGELFLYL